MSRIPLRPALRAYAHTPTAAPAVAAWANTKSTVFDGSDEYAENTSSGPSVAAGLSLSCWVKAGSQTSSYPPLIAVWESSLGFHDQQGAILVSGTSAYAYSHYARYASASGVLDGTWHHVVMTDDCTTGAGGNIRLYIDGTESSNNNTDARTSTDIAGTSIGKESTRYFVGGLDEVSTWSGILTAAEILAIYHSGTPTDLEDFSASSATLYSYYRMGDSAGDVPGNPGTLVDVMGNANLTTYNMESGDVVEDVPPT